MRCEADEQTSIRLRAGHVDEERLGLLDWHGLWRVPPLFPLLILIVFAIRDVPWQGQQPPLLTMPPPKPPQVERTSSNGIGPADERHESGPYFSPRRRSSASLEDTSSTLAKP